MILVTGAAGVMGAALTRRLHEQGHAVRGVCLPSDPLAEALRPYVADIWPADITDPDALSGCCNGVDSVYHCASLIVSQNTQALWRVNVEGTSNLLADARKHGVGHFIYISSASVLYPYGTPYSETKKRAESLVIESTVSYTILRPTLVYGPGRGGLEFDLFIDYLRRFPILPFIGNGSARKRPVFVEDIIDGLVALLGKGSVIGKIYNLSGAETISMYQFTSLCLALLGMPHKKIFPIPVGICRIVAGIVSLFLKNPPLTWPVIAGITQDADGDPAPAMEAFGYSPAGVTSRLPSCFPRT